MKKLNFKAGRTPEGKAFELAFVVLAILVCVYVALIYLRAPETIPTHFGPSGMPHAFGHKSKMLILCAIVFIVSACMMVGAYFPHSINLPGIDVPTERQEALGMRMVRVLGLMMLLLTAAIVHDMFLGHIVMVFVVIILMLLTCTLFIFLMYRGK